jgi:hypothetical protein
MNNKIKKVLLTGAILLSPRPYAVIGEESALLIQLVTTTASQLNELEKLLSNTEKYTKRMQQYNELVQDEYFKAERIKYLAEELAKKKEVEDLGDLNFAIRNLKYSMGELKTLMGEYSVIKSDEKKTILISKVKRELNNKKSQRAKIQVAYALRAKNTGRSTQLTAQNTALIYESQVELQNNQRELLDKVSTTNRLLSEELEEKRIAQMKKQRSYGLGSN